MSKKNLFIILGIITVLSVGVLLSFYVMTQKGTTTVGGTPSNPFANFFPFGQPAPSTSTGPITEGGNTQTGGELIVPPITSPLRQISAAPTAGFFANMKQGKNFVMFAEKETGNIFETKLEDMQTNRISNATIPGVHETFFGNSGKYALMRFLQGTNDTISSFLLDTTNPIKAKTIGGSSTTTGSTVPNGKFLQQNITDIFLSRDTNSAFYLTKTGDFAGGKEIGTIYNFQKGTAVASFQSPFTEWLPVFYDGSLILLQTKASHSVQGQLYAFNTGTGSFQKIFGDIKGLTTLPSPDGQKILYSASDFGGVYTYVYNRKDASNVKLSFKTLPEKCVWAKDSVTLYCAITDSPPSGDYPDDWYQGIMSFNDNLWKINISSGEKHSILVPVSRANQPMDIINMALSPNEDTLIFINKKDSSLWMFDLAGT